MIACRRHEFVWTLFDRPMRIAALVAPLLGPAYPESFRYLPENFRFFWILNIGFPAIRPNNPQAISPVSISSA